MNSTLSLPVFQHQLSDYALHLDFLRLRCGSEKAFAAGVRDVRKRTGAAIHSFIAFSEWDAVLVVPCERLYPQALTDIYANRDVAQSVSGTSGYFAYLWDHEVNKTWRQTLTHIERSGPSIVMLLRFADWFRQDIGLGAEILFCNYLHAILEPHTEVQAVVAHSLGWNDVILILHADSEEKQLVDLLTRIRLTTLAECAGSKASGKLKFSEPAEAQIFAASYSHLLGGFENFVTRTLSFGTLADEIESARLLIRVAPPHEKSVRRFMHDHATDIGANAVDSEMGHYSLSIDISDIAKPRGGKTAINFIGETRRFIGALNDPRPDSYAETTSIFRFEESGFEPRRTISPPTASMDTEIARIEKLLEEVPPLLRQRGASPMTSHRFVSVLTTILDHLFDPVRSSVVRHLSRFAATIPNRVRELNLDGVDDLCHVLEYAVSQAIDGIAQFQHDANALGLSGRGGYSRLIAAVEWYVRSAVIGLGMKAELPLITFGLRTGNAGSTGRYQIDIPFHVLFVPSRWHIILHEIGHLAWIHTFGWMMESLAMYRGMEREIRYEIERDMKVRAGDRLTAKVRRQIAERTHIEFLRTREIVRELFPSYLTFALPCNADIKEFDALALRPLLNASQPSSLYRELLLRVVTHCLLEIMQSALDIVDQEPLEEATDEESAARRSAAAASRAAQWWSIWKPLGAPAERRRHVDRINDAIESITDNVLEIGETRASDQRQTRRPMMEARTARLEPIVAAATYILNSGSFKASVREALESVIHVLALRAEHFRLIDPAQIGPPLFGELLNKIAEARRIQSDQVYVDMSGKVLAEWLHEGFVMISHRDSFVWSRLLLASRPQLLKGDQRAFLRSQLSVMLSMWHDAVTDKFSDYKALEVTLDKLKVIRTLETTLISSAAPAVPATRGKRVRRKPPKRSRRGR